MESLDPNLRFGVEFKDVSYSIGSKVIVKSFSGTFPSGSFTAIMGPSGSGKTTLLDILSGRSKGIGTVEGLVTLNGNMPMKKSSRSDVAYVKQEDILFPVLTVRETIYYSAKLRLPAITTEQEIHDRVESILETLWLTECADVKVGGGPVKGISGGQRRRVSVAVDLVTKPSVIFLDEPTTGLDSSASLVLMQALRRLADAGHTIVATIHQPRWEAYALLDNVMLMGNGRRVYHGPAKSAVEFLKECGFPYEGYGNPADWLLDIISARSLTMGDHQAVIESSEARCERLMQTFERNFVVSHLPSIGENTKPSCVPLSWSSQVKVLTHRYIKCIVRHPLDILFLLFEATIFGILIAVVWSNLEEERRVQNLGTFFLFFIATLCFMPVDAMPPLIEQRGVYLQERERNAYSPSAFFWAQIIAYTPPYAFVVLVALLWTYWTVGLASSASSFFFMYLNCCLVFWTMNSITFGTVFWLGSYGRAFAATVTIVIVNYLLMGVAVSLDDMGPHVSWASYLVFFQYSQAAFFLNEFGSDNVEANTYFPRLSDDKWLNIYVLIGFLLFARLVAFMLLKYRAEKIGSGTSLYSRIVATVRTWKEDFSVSDNNNITIDLDDLSVTRSDITLKEEERVELSFNSLSVVVNSDKKSASGNKKILHSLTGTFKPGTLTAIMGGSGSGKTTLLKVLSGRVKLPGQVEGDVYLNGIHRKNFKGLSRTVAYVTQDPLLHPTVTVREAITLSAKLRLPNNLTEDEIAKRVDSILYTLGLETCANTLIGDELTRGVSGGQKKRASVGIDLVTRPSVLLLDEPTSGLDSSSSDQVVQALRRLADAGHTVIVSIHQPRFESFSLFDDVLLMARGRLAYRGPAKDAPNFFEAFGYKMSDKCINPADYIVDVVNGGESSEIQENTDEAKKREQKAFELAELFSDHYSKSELSNKYQPLINANGVSLTYTNEEIDYGANWLKQAQVLTHRFVKVGIRNFYMYGVLLLESIVFGIFLAFAFGGTLTGNDDDPRKPVFRVGAWFGMLLTVVCYAPLGTMDANLQYYNIFLQERQRSAYRSSAFAIAYFIVSIIPNLLNSTFLVVFSYFVMDMPKQGFEHFLFLLLSLFAVSLSCYIIGTAITLGSGNRDISYSVQVIFFTFVVTLSGMFVPVSDLPSWFRFGYYINLSSYSFSAFMLDQYGCNNQLLNSVFSVPFSDKWTLIGILYGIVIFWELVFIVTLIIVSRQTKPNHL